MSTVALSRNFQVGPKPGTNSSVRAHVNAMRTSKLFDGFSELECEPFVALAKAQVFARGEHLFLQGDPLRRLTLILRGYVTLSQTNSEGEQAIVWLAGKGDALGWSDGMSSRVHSCSARISATCATLTWDLPSIDVLVAESFRLRFNLNRILFSRLEDLQERFCALATVGAERRLAMSVIRLAGRIGVPEPDGVRVSLTREEIARMSGTCMFTASRILARWTAAGLIRNVRHGIVIPHGDGLRMIAEGGE